MFLSETTLGGDLGEDEEGVERERTGMETSSSAGRCAGGIADCGMVR